MLINKIWKKCVRLSALLLFLIVLAGCRETEEVTGAAYDVYYLNREETKISAEKRYLDEELGQEEVIGTLLEELQNQPEDMTLKNSVGAAFQITSFQIEEGQLNIDMDASYRKLSATTEVLTRAALVRTLAQVEGINHVLMLVEGVPLTDSAGAAVGPMTADTFIDNAGEVINAYEMVTLRLFYASETGDRLVETSRTVVYNSNISMEKLVVENLIAGPDAEGAYPVLNPATKIVSVTVKDGTCYVNLDQSFLTQTYNVTADVVIYSIANSLAELSNVNRVQIAVDGKTDMIYRENFNLANLYERNLELIGTKEAEE